MSTFMEFLGESGGSSKDFWSGVGDIATGVGGLWAGDNYSGAAGDAMKGAEGAWAKGEEYLNNIVGLEGNLAGSCLSGCAGGTGGGGVATAQSGLNYAKDLAMKMNALGDEYGEFAQELWQNWENDYGTIKQNMIEYYENLDPEKYSVGMKAQQGKAIDQQFEQFDQIAAQSGIYTSGMKLQADKEKAFKKSEAFAQADISAPDIVADLQTQFYGNIAAPERAQALQTQNNAYQFQGTMMGEGGRTVNNAYGNLANIQEGGANRASSNYNQSMNRQYGAQETAMNYYGNVGQSYQQSAAAYGSAAGKSEGSGFSSLVSGIGSVAGVIGMFSDAKLKKNVRKVGEEKGYNIYEWDWNDEGARLAGDAPTVGVLAQEIVFDQPDAVMMMDGYLAVDYSKL